MDECGCRAARRNWRGNEKAKNNNKNSENNDGCIIIIIIIIQRYAVAEALVGEDFV
jgi:hypothetical protein